MGDAAKTRPLTLAEIAYEVLDEGREPMAIDEIARRVAMVRPATGKGSYSAAIRRAMSERVGLWEIAPSTWALAKWYTAGARVRIRVSAAEVEAGTLRVPTKHYLPLFEPATRSGQRSKPLRLHYAEGRPPLVARRSRDRREPAWTGLGPLYEALGVEGGTELFFEARDYEHMTFVVGVLPTDRRAEAHRALANRMLANAAERVLRGLRTARSRLGAEWIPAHDLQRRIYAMEILPNQFPSDPILHVVEKDPRFVVRGMSVRRRREGEALVGDAIAAFAEHIRPRLDERSYAELAGVLELFAEYLAQFTGVATVEELTSVEIGDFFSNYYILKSVGLTAARARNAMVCIKRLCYWLSDHYDVSADFHFNWVYAQIKEDLPRVVSIAEAFARAEGAPPVDLHRRTEGYWEVLGKRRGTLRLRRFHDEEEIGDLAVPPEVHRLVRKGDILGLELGVGEAGAWQLLRIGAAFPNI